MKYGEINDRYRKYIEWWFWAGGGMVLLLLIIGGITRLTGSGLSMTDWNLIMGVLPPMSDSAWHEAFRQYQQFPEYQQLNTGMTLGEFKSIFFWEYTHRLVARMIGLVFIGPFLWFWMKGKLTPKLFKRSMLLFFLGASQGAMGWIMVKSGLVDVPRVSHYRLAAHLTFAFALAGLCSWYALDMRQGKSTKSNITVDNLKSWMWVAGGLLILQIIWGAFVAGLDAGFIYNTFPDMNGDWVPRNMMALEPLLRNLVENPGTVQWTHRIIGTTLLIPVFIIWVKARNATDFKLIARIQIFSGLILLQYILGAITVLMSVPVPIGVLHQAVAMLIWISWLAIWHRIKGINEAAESV